MREILYDFYNCSSNANGLHVIKKLLSLTMKPEYGKYRSEILDIMVKNTIEMAQNPYGNYALQIVLDCYPPKSIIGIIESIQGKIANLSMTRYSSNVVEKCMERADEKLREELIKELMIADDLFGIIKNKFGNYVIQKAISLANPHLKDEFKMKLQMCIPPLPPRKPMATVYQSTTNSAYY